MVVSGFIQEEQHTGKRRKLTVEFGGVGVSKGHKNKSLKANGYLSSELGRRIWAYTFGHHHSNGLLIKSMSMSL